MSQMEQQAARKGYKQTELGEIPEDWHTVRLSNVFTLVNGFAFKGEHFGKVGPIVLTPGNFKLAGGLYFEDRNTKRYSASYPKETEFVYGDLVVVMTDLTPNCNLLGKPAFVMESETVLHNQRIGKLDRISSSWAKDYLYYTLLSSNYLASIRSAATGSTVRHTSNKTIYSTVVLQPPPKEQTAIANALSDTDALIASLEKLIDKKRATKTAAMQQLLTGKTRLPGFDKHPNGKAKGTKQTELGEIPEDWNLFHLGAMGSFYKGSGVNRDEANSGELPCVRYGEIYTHHHDVVREFRSFISSTVAKRARRITRGDLLLAGSGETKEEIGKCVAFVDEFEAYAGGDIVILRLAKGNPQFLGYLMNSLRVQRQKSSLGQGDAVVHISASALENVKVAIPSDHREQTQIAAALLDIDNEIEELKRRLEKTKNIKQGMMQELLTGRTRLL